MRWIYRAGPVDWVGVTQGRVGIVLLWIRQRIFDSCQFLEGCCPSCWTVDNRICCYSVMINAELVLGAFVQSRKAPVSFVTYVRPPVRRLSACHYGSQWTDFREVWYWGFLSESVEKIQIMLNLGKKMSGRLHIDLNVFHIVSNDVYSATINRTHCCVLIANLWVWHCWQRCVCQQYKENRLLRFCDKIGYANAQYIACRVSYSCAYKQATLNHPVWSRNGLLR